MPGRFGKFRIPLRARSDASRVRIRQEGRKGDVTHFLICLEPDTLPSHLDRGDGGIGSRPQSRLCS